MYEYVYVRMNIDIMNIQIRMNCMDIGVHVPSLIAGSNHGTNFYYCWLWLILFFVFTTADELAIAWISNESDQQEPWSGCRQHYDLAVGNMPPFEMWHRSTLAGL